VHPGCEPAQPKVSASEGWTFKTTDDRWLSGCADVCCDCRNSIRHAHAQIMSSRHDIDEQLSAIEVEHGEHERERHIQFELWRAPDDEQYERYCRTHLDQPS
jgi:hypothetical protein